MLVLQYQILRQDSLIFLQLTCYLICEICQVDTKYTDKKESGSEIVYFDVYVTFYVLCVFSHSPSNASLKVTFSLLILWFFKVSQYDIQNNNFRKRLDNTQKFTFDFVAFIFSFKYSMCTEVRHLPGKGFDCLVWWSNCRIFFVCELHAFIFKRFPRFCPRNSDRNFSSHYVSLSPRDNDRVIPVTDKKTTTQCQKKDHLTIAYLQYKANI